MIVLWVHAPAADTGTDAWDPDDVHDLVVDQFVILPNDWVKVTLDTGEIRWYPPDMVVRIDADPWDQNGLQDGSTVPTSVDKQREALRGTPLSDVPGPQADGSSPVAG